MQVVDMARPVLQLACTFHHFLPVGSDLVLELLLKVRYALPLPFRVFLTKAQLFLLFVQPLLLDFDLLLQSCPSVVNNKSRSIRKSL